MLGGWQSVVMRSPKRFVMGVQLDICGMSGLPIVLLVHRTRSSPANYL